MAISLDSLDEAFRVKVEALLESCLKDGVVMRPYFGLRKPEEQARLWRQSRAIEEIQAAEQRLRQSGAPFLADVLVSVGPQHGPHVTNALPGLSWHQWGEAVDCFWALNGQAEWSPTKIVDGINGYRFYANRAKNMGLEAGGLWPSFKDWPHVQLRAAGSPVSAGMSMAEIDTQMKQRFG
ncbi:MAG: M15 family metallopeptidase [Bosea sp.]|uniref:M15 family metallopeptidase n=1 Tax=Bosea sp. (in: a-proteobacteria) TaxID=1871050 RepID=UPI0023930213|nr:M15 family metallopeptidase [Bosea sp. (in: a-proteobacteria)]MCP4735963.1 M15 family metallopeptidase [Bosea sp. (in: a-proteobacteria)]